MPIPLHQDKREEKSGVKFYPNEEEKIGKECPNCNTMNELESKFCAECGYNFEGEKRCPKCGTRVSPTADICEACGEWLLEGNCKFCYADIEEGTTYCSECGNPVAGIVCPQCSQLSYFDFCKHCNIPLTGTAQKMLADMKNDPQKQDLLNIFQNYKQGLIETEKLNEILDKMKDIKFSSNQEARRFFMALSPFITIHKDKIPGKEKEDLFKMKAYIEKVEKKKKKISTPLFSERQKESIQEIDKIVNKEIKRREEEERKRQEEERRKQEEERKSREEEERQRRKGWICNAYGNLHSDGPADCADPSQGGHWVI